MPRNKDLKRLVRTRMQKTGESYTAAHSVITRDTTDEKKKYAAPREEWAALAGMTDDAVKAKTGRTWADWVTTLDDAGADGWDHREIARYLRTTFDEVSAWWSQTVTVGYERIRGLRDVGQRRGGSYDANKSRTFPVDVSALYLACRDARRRKKWLPEGVKRTRVATEARSIRFDWVDGTRVSLYFTPKGPSKSALSVQHGGLGNPEEVETTKAFWHERLDALGELLS